MCAPERIERPTASASSWITVSTICSGRLVQPGVDDLHAGVAQRAGDDLGAAVVAVEAGLGDDDADLALAGCVCAHGRASVGSWTCGLRADGARERARADRRRRCRRPPRRRTLCAAGPPARGRRLGGPPRARGSPREPRAATRPAPRAPSARVAPRSPRARCSARATADACAGARHAAALDQRATGRGQRGADAERREHLQPPPEAVELDDLPALLDRDPAQLRRPG